MKKVDLEREEPLLVNEVPEGNNRMSSRALFFQRKLYEKKTFNNNPLLGENKPIDLWYEKQLYGRVDIDGKAIQVLESRLKQIPLNTEESIFAIDFVVDAFMALRRYWKYLKSRSVLDNNSPYYNLIPSIGWVNTNTLYHALMEEIHFEQFKQFLVNYKLDKQILDFKSFMNIFLQFVDKQTPKLHLTRSKYIKSNLATPNISGLVIDLQIDNHGDDKNKVNKYLEDNNFPIFKEAAQRFGFKIDKHAPWRLVADINSPALFEYIKQNNSEQNKVIEQYFYNASFNDIETLKKYVVEFYNSIVSSKPYVLKPEIKQNKNCSKVKTIEISRSIEELTEIENKYDSYFWLRLYTFIRAREENLSWNQHIFDSVVNGAYQYYIGRDINSSISYIDRKCRITEISEIKNRNFFFKL